MSTRAAPRTHPDYPGRSPTTRAYAPGSTLAGREGPPRTMTRRASARGGSEVRVRRILRAAGWAFIGMGCFVLYFLVYQLVGTDLITNREQSDLRQKLAQEWSAPAPSKRGAALPVPQVPATGHALGVIQIPKIDLKKVVVQGANLEVLDNVRGADGKTKSQIVLTTCNPRFSAAQRLVVFSDLSSSVANTEGVGA